MCTVLNLRDWKWEFVEKFFYLYVRSFLNWDMIIKIDQLTYQRFENIVSQNFSEDVCDRVENEKEYNW